MRRPADTSEGTNICVVARCRGRSEREVAAKSCVVVDTASPGNNQVTVKTGDDLGTNKVYTVDRVFGAEADQSMVFDEIVAPIVDDFLSGMNCTIFAYGQTGTGKTYTMSGDDSVVNNSYAHDAGIIPRVLFRLFNDLEHKGLDHSVSCSFIELYNEELRDLLDDGDGKKVRIFDDAAKKSVTVQGLAECHFTSAIAGIQILQSGLRKRQVAATKINDLSSRSHTIFTLSMTFDRDGTGESATKAKINLVDLAGSENIGKSGAQNVRAREAGMINQSLLTLGRVINALVDRSSHIPYRESKLTRLLQDSLGGHTKTCIIATISPALVNIEETLSTLEYASRAKNIKNKPQTNNPSQKKTTLGEFSAELEKMRKDLVATRKKNGIYVDQDNYKELIAEKESQNILVNDQQRKLSTVERQLRAARELVEDTRQQLIKVNRELESTTNDLSGTLLNLENMGGKLKSTKTLLKQESILQRAHASSEHELQSVGRELIATLDQTIRDVNALHDKLELKHEHDQRAKDIIVEAGRESTSHIESLKGRLNHFTYSHARGSKRASQRIQEFVNDQLNDLIRYGSWATDTATGLVNNTQRIRSQMEQEEDQLSQTMGSVNSVRQQVSLNITQDLKSLESTSSRIAARVQQEIDEFQRGIKAPMDELMQFVTSSFEKQQRLISKQHDELTQLKTMLTNSAGTTQNVVEEQRQAISKAFMAEQSRAESEQKQLIEQVSQMMQQYTTRAQLRQREALETLRVQNLPKIVSSVSHSLNKPLSAVEKLHEQSSAQKSALLTDNTAIGEQVAAIAGCIDKYYGSASETAGQIQAEIMRGIEQKSEQISRNMDGLDEFLSKIEKGTARLSSSSVQGMNALCQISSDALSTMSEKLSAVQHRVEAWNEDSSMAELSQLWIQVEKEANDELDKISQAMASLSALPTNEVARPCPTVQDTEEEVPPRVPLNDISPVKKNKKVVEERIEKIELPMKRVNRFGLPMSKRMVPSRD
ncbi:kinesin-like protein Kip1p [Trichomonascus vanleenenianus]|uniref:kinesin-like protein Kip1p n=1 Tax=Trichomonascus vanleenenianus TaxID=2268995 RepID=UPI003ECAF3D4